MSFVGRPYLPNCSLRYARLAFGLLPNASKLRFPRQGHSINSISPRCLRRCLLLSLDCEVSAEATKFPRSVHAAARLRRLHEFTQLRHVGTNGHILNRRALDGTPGNNSEGEHTGQGTIDSTSQVLSGEIASGNEIFDTSTVDRLAVNVQDAEAAFDVYRTYETHELFVSNVLQMRGDPLASSSDRVVIYRGNPKAKLMIVGEAAGQEEERLGMPFVGKSGKLLDDIFTYAGFDMNYHVYITNVAKRRPPSNRNPTLREIEYYLPLLLEEIRLVDPSIIIIAGAIALRAVLNMSGIGRVRGQWFSTDLVGRTRLCMPVYHPSFLLRDPSKKYDMKVDIDEIRARYQATFPEESLPEPRRVKPVR